MGKAEVKEEEKKMMTDLCFAIDTVTSYKLNINYMLDTASEIFLMEKKIRKNSNGLKLTKYGVYLIRSIQFRFNMWLRA